METNGRVTIRQGVDPDITALIELEKRVYGNIGTDYYGEDHFRAWRRTHPEGLLVAECGTDIVGYQYAQRVDFSFDRIRDFGDYDIATDKGYTAASHRPVGNTLHSTTLCSVRPGAGRELLDGLFKLARRLGTTYTIGQARLPGFDSYMKNIENAGILRQAGANERDAALWYAMETARMVNGIVWPSAGPKPDLRLPSPGKPDPVVGGMLRFRGFGLAALLPGCMRDPQSRNYAALVAGESEKIH